MLGGIWEPRNLLLSFHFLYFQRLYLTSWYFYLEMKAKGKELATNINHLYDFLNRRQKEKRLLRCGGLNMSVHFSCAIHTGFRLKVSLVPKMSWAAFLLSLFFTLEVLQHASVGGWPFPFHAPVYLHWLVYLLLWPLTYCLTSSSWFAPSFLALCCLYRHSSKMLQVGFQTTEIKQILQ